MSETWEAWMPKSDEELEKWTRHSGFNAWRYGADEYEHVTPEKATLADVKEYLKWEEAWIAMGIPG